MSGLAEPSSVLDALTLETHWPVRQLRQENMYFNFHEIEEYLPGCRVRVAGYARWSCSAAIPTWA